jgi:hypothetical protein
MTRIRIIGLCLVAMFAMSAIAASAASAEEFAPERGVCKVAKKGLGEYLNATCTEKGAKGGAKKEFVWVPLAKAAAMTSKTGEATLKSFTPEGAELPAVTCKKSKGKGKIGATTSTSIVTFEECSSAGEKCTGGKKAKAGQIITFELEGTIGKLGTEKVGEDIVGKGPGGLSSEFKCGANEIKTRAAARRNGKNSKVGRTSTCRPKSTVSVPARSPSSQPRPRPLRSKVLRLRRGRRAQTNTQQRLTLPTRPVA